MNATTAPSDDDVAAAAAYTFVDALENIHACNGFAYGRRQLIRAGWAGTALLTIPQLATIVLRATGQTQPARFLPIMVLMTGIAIAYFTAGRILPKTPTSQPHPPRWYLTPLLGMWIFQGGAFSAQTSTPSIVIILVFASWPCVWGMLLPMHANAVAAVRRHLAVQLRAQGAHPNEIPRLVDSWLAQPFCPHRAELLIRVGYTLENATDHATQVVSDEDLAAVAYVQDNLR